MDWINLAYNRDKWRNPANTAMKYGLHKIRVKSRLVKGPLCPQLGLWTVALGVLQSTNRRTDHDLF